MEAVSPVSAPDVSSTVRILIADDNATDRMILKKLVGSLGFDVLAVEDGGAAVTAFSEFQPDIVLLDVLMPVMDGFEAAERIKALAGDAFVPVIFITSLQEADSLARCLDSGGDDFISKPFNSVILQAKLNAFNRMRLMHRTVMSQRDEIAVHNRYMMKEQEAAKRVFDKVAHAGSLNSPNIQYVLSPMSIFHGDIMLAGVGPSDNLMLLLADFTGHGLNAAIGAMPMAQTFYSMLDKGFSLREIVRELNSKLVEMLPSGVFCCTALADIDFQMGTLHFWNGGLPDCVLYRKADRSLVRLPSAHLPLGIVSGQHFNDNLEVHAVDVGDRLYLWSDGIHEAVNTRGDMYGEERLLANFSSNTRIDKLFREIVVDVHGFMSDGPAEDDVSLLEVEIVEPGVLRHQSRMAMLDEKHSPRDWSMEYCLRPETLRDFNPLPLLHYILMQIPRLRPMSGSLFTVLSELYANALEHGVLRLSSELKKSPDGFAEFYRLRQERLASLADGEIRIAIQYDAADAGGRLRLMVADSGDGFDHTDVDLDMNDNDGLSGRGLPLIFSLAESVTYNDRGNEITVVFLCVE